MEYCEAVYVPDRAYLETEWYREKLGHCHYCIEAKDFLPDPVSKWIDPETTAESRSNR